ncbi:MAG: hypothetical protein RL653_593 [Pseudomonadota bacterium]
MQRDGPAHSLPCIAAWALLTLSLGACSVPTLDSLEQVRPSSCNAEHPCASGYVCVGGTCVVPVPGAGEDAGTPDAGTPDAGTPDAGTPDAGTPDAGTPDADRRILVLIYDPLVPADGGTARLSSTQPGWTQPGTLVQQLVDWWNAAGAGTYTFAVADTVVVDTFPVKTDGFAYSPAGYLGTLSGQQAAHSPDSADVAALLNASNACARANAGWVNEVWLLGGPWFGFDNMAVAGPQPGWLAGFPYVQGTGCNGVLPVMGFSYERGLLEALKNFDVRVGTSLEYAHGGRSESIRSPWDLFTLKDPSFRYGFKGCGQVNEPPNGGVDQFDSTTTVQSICEDFAIHPSLAEVAAPVKKPLSCSAWQCTEHGYRKWWWAQARKGTGVDAFGRSANWLALGLDPTAAEDAAQKLPCGWLTHSTRCANSADCRWSTCASACVPSGVTEAAVGCSCPANETLQACDITAGCAWYRCQVLCQAQGIPLPTGCGSMPYTP